MNIKIKIKKYGVQNVANIYLIKQDISRVKLIYKTVNKTVLQISVQLYRPPVME